MCKQIAMRWLFCNKVNTVLLITVDCTIDNNRGLSMFQNLLWVYGMSWMSVRFPGLKFCPSPPLPALKGRHKSAIKASNSETMVMCVNRVLAVLASLAAAALA